MFSFSFTFFKEVFMISCPQLLKKMEGWVVWFSGVVWTIGELLNIWGSCRRDFGFPNNIRT